MEGGGGGQKTIVKEEMIKTERRDKKRCEGKNTARR
jgi:hypothetical protein